MCPRIPNQTIILKLGNLQCRSFNSFVNFLQPLLYLESQRIFLAVHIKINFKPDTSVLHPWIIRFLFFTRSTTSTKETEDRDTRSCGIHEREAYAQTTVWMQFNTKVYRKNRPAPPYRVMEDTLGADERLQRSEGIQVSISRGNQAESTPSWSLPSKTHREILFDTKRRG